GSTATLFPYTTLFRSRVVRMPPPGVEAAEVSGEGCGLFALWLPGAEPDPVQGRWLRLLFGERAYLAVELHREQDDAARLARLEEDRKSTRLNSSHVKI